MKCADFKGKTAYDVIDMAEKANLEMNQDWENETTIIKVDDGEIAVSGREIVISMKIESEIAALEQKIAALKSRIKRLKKKLEAGK